MKPAVGERIGSTVCGTEVIVVRPAGHDIDLTCGKAPMAPVPAQRGEEIAHDGPGTLVGKRYVHPGSELEVLCTKAGAGQLRVDGGVLAVKDAKNLPSSD